jgi:ABC-type branched-subunit amino acid transport system substrate-binding protein
MKKSAWIKILGSFCVLMLISFFLGNPRIAGAQDKDALRIGILLPLTGPSAVTGEHSRRGATLAAEEINAAGGILGRKIELVFGDDESNPAVGVAAAERLITKDKVEILAGTYNSSVCLAVMDVPAKYGIPYISGGATSDQIGLKRASDQKKFRAYYKPVSPSYVYGQMWTWFWEYMIKENQYKPENKNIAIVNENSAWGNAITDAIRKYLAESELTKQGFKIALADQVPLAETDFLAEISKIKASKPGIVFGIFAAVPTNSSFQKQFVNAGIKVPACSCYTPDNPEFIKVTGPAANGLIWNSAINLLPTKEGKHYREVIQKRFQKDVEVVGSIVYDLIYMIREAYQRAGSFEKEKFLNEMDKTKYVGAAGVYMFDPRTHEALAGEDYIVPLAYQIQDGKNKIIWPKKFADATYTLPSWMK